MKYQHIVYCILMMAMLPVLFSCERNINIKLPYSGDKIVLNALLSHDSIIYARITKSMPVDVNVTAYPEIQGAQVTLFENNIVKGLLAEKIINGKRYYVSPVKVKSGNQYVIKVTYDGYPAVQATDKIPGKPSFEPLQYRSVEGGGNNSGKRKLTIKLKDAAGIKNYYRIRVFPSYSDKASAAYFINYSRGYSFTIDNFANDNGIFGNIDNEEVEHYFTDETFDGQEVTIYITLDSYSTGSAAHYTEAAVELSSFQRLPILIWIVSVSNLITKKTRLWKQWLYTAMSKTGMES